MTDADGEFKVSLPDGDWAVKVKMPSGSVYAVGQDYLTASSGKVTDASGRNVPEFRHHPLIASSTDRLDDIPEEPGQARLIACPGSVLSPSDAGRAPSQQ